MLGLCTIESFREPLASNSKGPTKCVSLNNHQCRLEQHNQLGQHMLI